MYHEFTFYPYDVAEFCGTLDELNLAYAVDDPAEFRATLESNSRYWDYVDEAITADRPASVTVYFTADRVEAADSLRPLAFEVQTRAIREEDWANNWKPFWQAASFGANLVVVPSWKTVVRLDPGMMFGTGGHATTALCLEAAERVFSTGTIASVLDIGCGSGILAITAMLLGATRALGLDVDPNMPTVASSNAALNAVEPEFRTLDIFEASLTERFDLVFANIVADVIVRLAPLVPGLLNDGGTLIASGIIGASAAEVESALFAAGLQVVNVESRDDWVCMVARNR
ncbi:MAG: 50S ribosomal protein L11 methyltransferase [Oscillospiraceae bacterium]|nr:50S ribosomal protein L11 methyltransferase [Oscillospiraceae bacterium]